MIFIKKIQRMISLRDPCERTRGRCILVSCNDAEGRLCISTPNLASQFFPDVLSYVFNIYMEDEETMVEIDIILAHLFATYSFLLALGNLLHSFTRSILGNWWNIN